MSPQSQAPPWERPFKLEGARCLVTGCSSGIGRATALALRDAGAQVWATARQPAHLEELEGLGLQPVQLDIRDLGAVAAAVAAADPVDLLVNNAGYGIEGAVEEISDAELFGQYDVNVFGPWRLCRATLPSMRERGRGAIVNISSFGAHAPYPTVGAYRSSKFALDGFAWTLHLEVTRFGIRVLNVEPGLVETDFSTRSYRRAAAMSADGPYAGMYASARRAYSRMSPVALEPETVAAAIVDELRRPTVRLRLPVGEDAKRLIAAADEGAAAYDRYLAEGLGFDWHTAGGP